MMSKLNSDKLKELPLKGKMLLKEEETIHEEHESKEAFQYLVL